MPGLVPRRFVVVELEFSSAIGSRFRHEGQREREREKETLGNRDEARVFSLLSRAELITRRTANRAKRQSGYILSRIRDAFAYAH